MIVHDFALVRDRITALKGQADLLDTQIVSARDRMLDHQQQAEYHAEALQILQILEERWRGNVAAAIEGFVSKGLCTVFSCDMSVNVDTKLARGIASTTLGLTTDGLKTPILGSKGGSVINVLSFLWHVLLTVSSKPKLAPVLVLDEPFSHVSAEYRPLLCSLLREIRARGLQIIMSSHEEEMMEAADVVYLVENDGKVATVSQIKGMCEERD